MRLLLDTCTFLRIVAGATKVPQRVREWCAEPANDVYVSAVSV